MWAVPPQMGDWGVGRPLSRPTRCQTCRLEPGGARQGDRVVPSGGRRLAALRLGRRGADPLREIDATHTAIMGGDRRCRRGPPASCSSDHLVVCSPSAGHRRTQGKGVEPLPTELIVRSASVTPPLNVGHDCPPRGGDCPASSPGGEQTVGSTAALCSTTRPPAWSLHVHFFGRGTSG